MRLRPDPESARLERIFALDNLAGLSKKEVRRVIQAGTLVTVSAGHVVTEEDAHANGLYVVISGTLTVTQRGERVSTTGQGDILGEVGTVAGYLRTATVTADVESELLHFSGAVVAQLSDEVPAFREILDRAAGKRLSRDRHTE